MTFTPPPLENHLRQSMADLTATERKLVAHLLDNYPVAALGSITALAKGAQVSTPTVARLVQKLGFKGYPDFQTALRAEVGDMLAAPQPKGPALHSSAPEGHVLNRFSTAIFANLQATLAALPPQTFDALAAQLADPERRIFALGGRITQSLAQYFTTQLQMIRPQVTLLTPHPSSWPTALLDMRPKDVLLLIDIRRYEASLAQLAELASQSGAEVALITDRWISPAAAHARHVLPCHIQAPSAWDSSVTLLTLLEALLAATQDLRWQESEARLHRLEALSAQTKLFRATR